MYSQESQRWRNIGRATLLMTLPPLGAALAYLASPVHPKTMLSESAFPISANQAIVSGLMGFGAMQVISMCHRLNRQPVVPPPSQISLPVRRQVRQY